LGKFAEIIEGKGWAPAMIASAIVVMYMMILSLVPIRMDNDCWWHVKTGKIIAQQGLPEHDVFAYTAAEYEWHNHEWLAQVAAYQVWRMGERTQLGGWRAVILATACVNAAAFLVLLILAGRLSENWWIALLVVLVAAGIGRRMFVPRPPAMTNLLLAIQILILVGAHNGWFRARWLAILPAIFALWANVHGGWLAGLVVLGAFLMQDVTTALRSRFPVPFEDATHPLTLRTWAWLFPACIAGTMVNPYLWQLYELPVRVLSEHQLVQVIGELRPPDLFYVRDFVNFIVITILFLAVSRGRRVRLSNLLIFLFFLLQALQHVRHLVLLGVTMVPFWTRLADSAFRELAIFLRESCCPFTPAAANRAMGVTALVAALGHGAFVVRNVPETDSYLVRNRQYAQIRDGFISNAFPTEAAEIIHMSRLEGNMFNENNFAGYLIWSLSPDQHQVFSDSRFDIFGGDLWRQEEIVSTLYEGDEELSSWSEVLDKWEIQWGLTRGNTRLARALRDGLDGWAVAADFGRLSRSTSPDLVLFIRDTPENAAMLQRTRRIFETRYAWVTPSQPGVRR
jgi:hypothetical protein